MKFFYCLIFFCASLLSVTKTKAQYLEFAENKGQWNSKVTYASDMGGMAFFLEKQGYKVLLNNKADLEAVEGYYGGHNLEKNNASDPYHAGQINSSSKSTGGKINQSPGLHSHTYEVTFPGSSANPEIVPEKIIDTYNNYYLGNDPSKWASHCRLFQAVTYKNIYPNIDVRYYTNNGQLKYDIIINPGGDIRRVALKFDGTDGLSIKGGNLIIKTSVGNVTELSPVAYQPSAAGRTKVDVKFFISGSTVYFQTGNFSNTLPLVIDPTLIFSSLTKSTTDNWGYTATYDNDGNFYAGGIAFGNGFPTANGPSFQPNFEGGAPSQSIGGHDVAIIKLSARGNAKIFATYLGGTANEQPHSMVVDNNGDLIVAGRTESPDFPVTSKTAGPGGGWDIFITKFMADGSALVASRKIGGKGDDGVNIAPKELSPGAISIRRNYGDDARSEVITDNAGNIYLASCTRSTAVTPDNILSTPGVFQPNFGGGSQDGMLIKTDPNLNILFSSYLGGNGDDAAFVLALNPLNNDIYVGGATNSTDLKKTDVNNASIIHSSFQGGQSDGFVTIISNDGTTQKRTIYVGTRGNDMLYGVQFDRFGYPYIMGTTTESFPLTGNVAFNSQPKGHQYITKLGQDLSNIQYSTNFGKSVTGDTLPDISPVAFLVDRCENVYVSGWGGGIDVVEGYPNAGTTGLSVTSKNPNDILQKITDGKDFYFFVLEKNAASQLYGSYFGELPKNGQTTLGDHVDGGTSRFDKNGIIYQAICANCGKSPSLQGTGFPTSGGNTWGQRNISTTPSYCNEAAVKIAFELAGVSADLRTYINGVPRDTSGCIPLTVDFVDTIALAKQYIWDFGDGSATVKTTSNRQSHTYNNVGDYTVKLIAIDSESCNVADTVYTHIRARSDYAQLKFTAQKLNPCDSLNYMFVNQSVPPPNKPFSGQSLEWSFGDGSTLTTNADTIMHRYGAPGTYEVALRLSDTNYCNAPDADSIKLRVATNVKAQFNIATGCAPYNAVVDNTSIGGHSFYWDFGDGSTSTNSDPVHLFANQGTYTVSLIVIDSSTCNIIDSTKRTVQVGITPTAGFSVSPIPPQEDKPATFTNTSASGNSYKWDFGDGDTLFTYQHDTSIIHQYIGTGTYTACLYTFTNLGCADTSCGPVEAIVNPLVDVPNAFTPNGDNINDEIHVKGFGISKMNWKIFNRWGTLIFESTSPDIGWNGYYKGVLQAQDVYTYVLDVVFFDGKRYQKKGDITLLR
ncbi:MAG TPA: PKD domain-containing protein [Chitinophagaceae bacterium]|nr:PKD domain-containing protein [Chitinophagaceae bacterium]